MRPVQRGMRVLRTSALVASLGCSGTGDDGRGWDTYSVGDEIRRFPADPDLIESAAMFIQRDGFTYIADRMAGQVRSFDAAGELQWSFGRSGSGPGEFRQMDWLSAAPDGDIWVGDNSLQRITVISADGAARREAEMNSPVRSAVILPGNRMIVPGLRQEASLDTLTMPLPVRNVAPDRTDLRGSIASILGRMVVGSDPTWLVDTNTGQVWAQDGSSVRAVEVPDWLAIKVEESRAQVRRAVGGNVMSPVYRAAHATPSGDLWLLLNGVSGVVGVTLSADAERPGRRVIVEPALLRGLRDALAAGDTLTVLYETEVRQYRLVKASN